MSPQTKRVEVFDGFPVAALDFYDDLELENTKAFWSEHKDVYESAVRAPMVALTDALTEEFGPAKLFRPYRDVRFSHDKTPYKTHQGAYVSVAPACGWYVQISPAGVFAGGGFYGADAPRLARVRAAIDDERRGSELRRILDNAQGSGFTVGGDTLKRAPRGFAVDHPRIDLLRHRSLSLRVDYGFGPLIHSGDLLGRIRADWSALRPLVDWLVPALEG